MLLVVGSLTLTRIRRPVKTPAISARYATSRALVVTGLHTLRPSSSTAWGNVNKQRQQVALIKQNNTMQ
jgi:hypothetical protein